jgi:hypothetical protein
VKTELLKETHRKGNRTTDVKAKQKGITFKYYPI